jgi:hypothetical protein
VSQIKYGAWLCFGFVAATGCATGVNLPNPNGNAADSGSPEADAGTDAGGTSVYGNPDGDGLITVSDAGVVQIYDPTGAPTCGASSFEAEKVLVDTIVEVPHEITEEITEDVTVDVTVDVTTVKPTVLYLMFDQSLSMKGGIQYGMNFGANKWNPAVTALKSFVNDPESAGLGVALQYFPIPGSSYTCAGAGYSSPSVTAGNLPGRASAISTSLDQHSPSDAALTTPIEGALRGVTQYCKKYQADHPSEQCVAVLVTDGEPNGCESNHDKLAKIAKDAHDIDHVITFAVGLSGANFPLLDKIAQQGGAPDCDTNNSSRYSCDVSSGADKLSMALNTIREKVVTKETHQETHQETHPVTRTETRTEVMSQVVKSAVPCEWSIPATTGGQTFDRDRVNVRLRTGDKQTTFVRVDSKDKCQPSAWYFDDANKPKRIIACEQSCQAITAAPDARIDILLGCATITPG